VLHDSDGDTCHAELNEQLTGHERRELAIKFRGS
jgi:hypothetical protein